MRCEDYPCCGHAGDPDGCPDMNTVNTCLDCGRSHPDNRCFDYCGQCVARFERGGGWSEDWVRDDDDRDVG